MLQHSPITFMVHAGATHSPCKLSWACCAAPAIGAQHAVASPAVWRRPCHRTGHCNAAATQPWCRARRAGRGTSAPSLLCPRSALPSRKSLQIHRPTGSRPDLTSLLHAAAGGRRGQLPTAACPAAAGRRASSSKEGAEALQADPALQQLERQEGSAAQQQGMETQHSMCQGQPEGWSVRLPLHPGPGRAAAAMTAAAAA